MKRFLKRKLKRNFVNGLISISLTFIIAFICTIATIEPEAKQQETITPVIEIFEEKTENLEVKEEAKEEVVEEMVELKEEKVEPVAATPTYIDYRLTSFYANDGYGTGSCTGSGLCEKDFQINEHGWYTYNGKLVLAGATTYLQKSFGYIEGRHYFRYYDEVTIIIDGVTYTGIILDSCGASMKVSENRLDLFVSGKNSVIDRGYRGKNMVQVSY